MKSIASRPLAIGCAVCRSMFRTGLMLAIAGLLVLSCIPLSRVRAASGAATIQPSAGKPLVNLRTPAALDLKYTGSVEAVSALREETVHPTALATADFNADGAPDVVAGYATKGGGVLTVLMGNPDAFAPKDTSLFAKAMHGDVAATFLSTAKAYVLPESPDLIVTGDFNRDSNRDVLVAARGGRLYVLAGDGTGGLGAPEVVSLGGAVRAMAATGDGHVAVSIDGGQGPELVILAPGPEGLNSITAYPLPARGDAVLWGDLGGGADVAVGAGNHIAIIYNALKENPRTETVDLPFNVAGLTAGNFIWDRDGRTEMAALADDGSVKILQHGSLDTRPLTAGDIPGRRTALRENRKQQQIDPTSLGSWIVASKLARAGSAPLGPVGPSAFSSPHLAASPTHDLMVLDGGRSLLSILDTSGKMESRSADVSFSSVPVAALTLPQKIDARRDTVILAAGEADPIILSQNQDPVFNVTTTADTDAAGACGDTSTVTSSAPPLSLREAICEANNSGAGTYTINVPAGTYSLNISTLGGNGSAASSGELQVGMQSGQTITISGAGASSTIIKQTDGIDRVIEEDQLQLGNMPLTISNLTLTGGHCSTGLDCGFSGGALVAGNLAGDSLTLTDVTVSNNSEQADTPALGGGNQGGGVSMAGPNCTITNSTFSGNSVTASSTDAGVGGGVEFLDDAPGSLTVTGSIFSGNSVQASSNGAPGGGLWIDLQTVGDTATISGSTFTGNTAGGSNGEGGAIYAAGLTTVTNSRITGNTAAGGGSGFWEQGYPNNAAAGVGTVKNNWWGCNGGPGATGCDTVEASPIGADDASVVSNPWLELSIGANPTAIQTNATSTLTASITTNSNGVGGFTVPNGTPVTFGGTLGTVNPIGATFSSGLASSTFTAGTTGGTGTGTATVDNQIVGANIHIQAPTPLLSVTKTHTGTFTQGSTAHWNIGVSNTVSGSTTSGTVSVSDTLPSGYTLSSYSGSGWACGGSTTVSCTSTSSVAGGSSFSTIQLIVNVPSNSPTSVSNTALAWGGGDLTHSSPGSAASGTDSNVSVAQVPAVIGVSGGGTQSTGIGMVFGTALSATVKDAGGVVISGASVTFAAPGSGASGTFSNSSNTIVVNTSSSGVASETFAANTVAGAYSLTASVAGVATPATFSLTNNPGGATNFSVSGPGSTTAGVGFFITVTAQDAYNNTVTGYTGTVRFTSSDMGAGPFLPPNYTFTSGNAGVATFPVTLVTAGIQTVTVTDTVTSSITGSAIIAVFAGPARSLAISVPPSSFAGAPFNFTVTAFDPFGNVATGYGGTVTFTSTDPASTLPAPSTLTTGTGTFSATLLTPGSQTITVMDASNELTIQSSGITVSIPNLVVNEITDGPGLSFECSLQPTPGNTTNSDTCSLRDALLKSASLGSGNITFDSTAFAAAQSILLTSGTLNIPSNTTITGPTTGSGYTLTNLVTVSGDSASTVFTEASGVTGASLSGLIVTGGLNTSGGGISNSGTLTVTNSTISGNSATASGANAAGGGIFNAGTMTLSNSTISGNSATASGGLAGGGGIAIQGGSLTLNNSTITGNTTAAGGNGGGGGIVNNGGTLTVTNSTVSANSADGAGGGVFSNEGTSTLTNTVVSGNTAPANPDFAGPAYTDNGGNQVGVTGINLAPLAPNGGPTQTSLPLPGSTAICAGIAANATTAGLTTDQRGIKPGFDTNCPSGSVDSGAVQTNYAMSFTTDPPSSFFITQAISPAPVVALTESGVAASTANSAIALSDTASLLGGTTTANLASGSAAFSNLIFSSPTTGSDMLTATLSLNPGLAPPLNLTAQSSAFQVNALPPVTLSASSINYGVQVVETSSPSQTVTLTNNTGSALAISSIAVTGANASSFVFATTTAFQIPGSCGPTLAAGTSCIIHGHFSPTTTGLLTASVTITDNASNSPQTISLSGTGITTNSTTVSLSAPGITFPGQEVGTTSASQEVTLTNTGGATLSIVSIAVTGPNASSFVFGSPVANTLSYCAANLASGASCLIHGHFKPMAAGPLTATVVITDSATGSPQFFTVSGTGIAPQAVSLSAPGISFAGQEPGRTSASQSVILTNSGGEPLHIASILVTGADASSFLFNNNCGARLVAGASCTIHGHFTPTASGALTAAVTISDDASDSPQTITLTGTGDMPPAVELSVPSISFNAQAVGTTSASQDVTMTNTGGSLLTIASMMVTGTNASSFIFGNTCGTRLPAGASCTIHGHFTPTATGPLSAAVAITDNAGGSPQSITLNGTGQ